MNDELLIKAKHTLMCSAASATLIVGLTTASVQAQEAAAQDAASEEEVEVIVVTGIRGSLKAAIDKKRAADDIRDVINAEDIGKLPDTNVAEALQRITGVQIGRDMGEGSEIAVRGMSQIRVEVNGQTQPGRGAETGVSFENLPAALFSSLEVIKTPSADITEGALGAVIQLNTRKPLEVTKDFTVSGSVKNVYSGLADKWSPTGSATITKNFRDMNIGDVGVILSVNYNERKLRQDTFELRGWLLSNGWGLDLDGDGVANEDYESVDGIVTDRQDAVYQPGQFRSQLKLQDRKNTTYTGAVQWEPNSRVSFHLDGSYTKSTREDSQFVSQAQVHKAKAKDFIDEYSFISDDASVLTGYISPATKGNQQYFSGSIQPYEAEIYTISTGADWAIRDNLDMKIEYSKGSGETNREFHNLGQGIKGAEWPSHYFDFTQGTDLPTLQLFERKLTSIEGAEPIDLTAASTYTFNQYVINRDHEENEENTYKIDFDWHLDKGIFQNIEFGGRISSRSGSNSSAQYKNKLANADRIPFDQLEADLPGMISPQPADYLEDATGDVVRNWPGVNTVALMEDQGPLLDYLGMNDPDLLSNQFDKAWRVREETQAVYLKFNIGGDLGSIPFRGNFGMRYVHTNVTSNGYETIDASGSSSDPANNTAIKLLNSYGNLLPSLNLTFILKEDIFLRFAAGKAMSRPKLVHQSPTIRINWSAGTGNIGNPDILPETADSLDASLEYYFGEGGLLSVAAFYKNFKNSIELGFQTGCVALPDDEVDYDPPELDGCGVRENFFFLSQWKNNPVNLSLKGLELSYQQPFTFLPAPFDGLGVQANYTLTDTNEASQSKYGFNVGRQDLSKHSYNLVAYYEKNKFSARAAYNWRSSYYDKLSYSGGASISEAYGQLDLSVSYKVMEGVTITADAQNIAGKPRRFYEEIEERFLAYKANDRRFQIGLRANF